MQLTEEGTLSLEDTLTDWLPTEISSLIPNASEITLEQILNHTSGIADYLDVLTGQALSNPALFLQEWESSQLLGFLDGIEPFFEPGTDWQYSNSNYILAGLVIEAATGNSYGQEIRDRILAPLSLDNTFVAGEEEIPGGYIKSYWDFNNQGTLDNLSITNLSWTGSAGSIISNTEDLAAFFDGLLVVVEGELTFADLNITQAGNRTLLGITSSGETLAILRGVEASGLTESSFEIVSNVSTIEEALDIL